MSKYAEEFRKLSDPEEIKSLLILIRARSREGETEAREYCVALGRVGCPLDLDGAVQWQIQNNKSSDVFRLINSSNPEDVRRGFTLLDAMARSGDTHAIKYFKVLQISGCPADLEGAINWYLQNRTNTAARATTNPTSSGGCLLIVGVLVPLSMLTGAVIKILF